MEIIVIVTEKMPWNLAVSKKVVPLHPIMIQLTKEEFENWKSQFVISNYDEDMSSQFAMTSDENLKSQNVISNEGILRSQIVTIETEDEFLRSQNATLKVKQGQNIKYLPYAFTENGIAMLSSILRSSYR